LVHPLSLKGPAATAALSLLSLAGLALLTTIRASPQPTALLQGLLSVVLFGLGVLLGQLSPSTSLGDFWRHDVVGMGVGLLVAAGVTPVTSWAVAPSLAADEVGEGGGGTQKNVSEPPWIENDSQRFIVVCFIYQQDNNPASGV
jgi:hypothetical protein